MIRFICWISWSFEISVDISMSRRHSVYHDHLRILHPFLFEDAIEDPQVCWICCLWKCKLLVLLGHLLGMALYQSQDLKRNIIRGQCWAFNTHLSPTWRPWPAPTVSMSALAKKRSAWGSGGAELWRWLLGVAGESNLVAVKQSRAGGKEVFGSSTMKSWIRGNGPQLAHSASLRISCDVMPSLSLQNFTELMDSFF